MPGTPIQAVVAGPVSSVGTGPFTLQITITPTPGNLLKLLSQYDNSRTITGILDDAVGGSNAWAIKNTKQNTTNFDVQTWEAPNVALNGSGTLTLTLTFNLATSNIYYALVEIGGLTASPADKVAAITPPIAAGTTGTTTSTGTLAQADEFVGMFSVSETASRPISVPAGMTRFAAATLRASQFVFDYMNVAAATALTATATVTGGTADIIGQLTTWKNKPVVALDDSEILPGGQLPYIPPVDPFLILVSG